MDRKFKQTLYKGTGQWLYTQKYEFIGGMKIENHSKIPLCAQEND